MLLVTLLLRRVVSDRALAVGVTSLDVVNESPAVVSCVPALIILSACGVVDS